MTTKSTIFWLAMAAIAVPANVIVDRWRDLPINERAEDDCAMFHGARILSRVEHNDKTGGVTCFYRL